MAGMARRITIHTRRTRITAVTAAIALTAAGVLVAPAAAQAAARVAPMAATDVAAPQLVGTVTAAPTVVDITTGDATSTVAVRLTDDLSGVTTATVTLTSPLGSASTVDLRRSGGTAQNGTWTGTADFTGFDPAGTWTPSELIATDAADHTLDRTDGLGTGITVVRIEDTVAPTLLAASVDSTSVDTSAGPGEVELTVRASDDLSGVNGGAFEFTSPDGDQTAEGTLSGPPTSGTSRDGTWAVDVTFPARSAPGRWTLTHAEVADGQDNTSFYDAPGSAALPNLAVTVRTDDDTSTPQLTGFRIGPATISTGYQPNGYVYAHVDFTDTGSGLASAVVTLRRPDGKLLDVEPGDAPYDDPTPRSGTSRSGSLVGGVYADFSQTGTWTVASVVLTDLAGNVRTYATADLGSRASFVVSSAKNDTLAPTVTGLAFSPIRLDVRTGSADGTVLVGVKDPDAVPAGFDSGTVRLTGPSGTESVDGTVSSYDLADGDPADGTFRGAFTLDQGATGGTWTVASLSLSDAAGNTRTYASADLTKTLGSVPTLAVVGTGTAPPTTPAPPHLDSVTLDGTSATVTWTPPTDTGGAPVTGYVVTPWLGAAPQPATTVGPVTGTTVTGLSGGRTYTFTVAARSSAGTGTASAASEPVTVPVGRPGAPTIGSASVDGTTATVRWTAPRDDGGATVTGYVVTPFLGTVAQTPVTVGDVRTASVDDLARGRTYTFAVAAVNTAGPGPSSVRSTPVSVAATTTALTVSTTTSAVTYGTAVPVTGVLTRVDTGGPLVGRTVTLQYRSATGSWATDATTARTSSTGLVSFPDFRPGRSVQVRLVARPGTEFTVATSSTRTVSVRRALTLGSNHATIARGKTVTLTGRLTPADPGTTVRLQRLLAGAWTTVATQRAARSGYSFTLSLRTAGTRTFRVSTLADDDFATSTSPTRTVRVR